MVSVTFSHVRNNLSNNIRYQEVVKNLMRFKMQHIFQGCMYVRRVEIQRRLLADCGPLEAKCFQSYIIRTLVIYFVISDEWPDVALHTSHFAQCVFPVILCLSYKLQ